MRRLLRGPGNRGNPPRFFGVVSATFGGVEAAFEGCRLPRETFTLLLSSHPSLSSLLIPPLPGMEKCRRDPSHCLLDDRHLYYNQITSLPATAFNALTSLRSL